MTIKFNQYNVTNGKVKARVFYTLDNRADGKKCITIYAKDYNSDLYKIFPNDSENNTDLMTDYFETTTVRIFEENLLYAYARQKIEAIIEKKRSKRC